MSSLTANTAYTFKAYSDGGCTDELASAAPYATLPPKPTTPTVAAGVGSGKLTLSSSATSGGDLALTKWQYTTDNGTNWKDISSTSTTLSHTVTDLDDDTSYRFRVRAWNASGESAASDQSQAVAPADETLTVSKDTITGTGATLTIGNWQEKWYYKYTSPDGGSCSDSAVPKGTSSKAVTGLESNTSYTFKAYSDSTCDTELAAATAFPTLPPKPAKPAVTAGVGSGKIDLSSSVSGGDVALTKWQYTTDDGSSWTDISNSTSKTLSHTVSGLTNDTDYTFKVRAWNASGAGEKSDASDSATPEDETLTAGTITATGATLTIGNWSAAWHYKYTSPSGGGCSTQAVPAGTPSQAVTGLDSNTAYTFKAYSDSGCSAELAAAAAFPTLPPKPAKPTMAVGNTELTLSSSVSGGSAALTEWQYKRKVGTGNFDSTWTKIGNITSKTLSHTFTGLTNNTDYSYKVRALNASGAGEESDASQVMAPTDATLEVDNITTTGARLTIIDPPTNLTTWYYKYTPPDDGQCTSASGTTANVTGLEKGTQYTFELYRDSTCETSLGLTATFTTLQRDAPGGTPTPGGGTPPAPSKPVVTAGDGQVTLSWTSNGDGGSAITEWEYQQKEGSRDWGPWTDICVTASDADCPSETSWTVTDLTNGTAYRFRVRAVNANGAGGASPESEAATPAAAPPAPSKPAVVGGDGQVTLTWTSNGDGGSALTEWEYQQKEGSGDWGAWTDVCATTSDADCPGKTSWTVTNLSNGTAYRFKVRAVNATGAGAASPESEAVTPAAAPPASGLRAAVKRTLAAVARRSLSSALDQIGARFAASVPPSGLTLAGRAVTPDGAGGSALAAAGDGACPAGGLPRHGSGERLGLAAFGSGGEGCGGWRSRTVTGDELLGGSGFSWLLGAAPGAPGADPSAPLWSVWGRGDLGTFEGRPSGSRYRGELRTGWLGMDARAGAWVAGFAVSHGTGGADYHSDVDVDADAAGGGAEEQGRLETVLTALYPYARWTFPDGLELRGVLGAGTGETRHWPDGGAAREKSGLRMYMASLGARRALPAAAGIDLAARGDASLSRLETGAGPDDIDGLSADTWRARLGLEASRRVDLGGDAALTPFVETAVRRDGGDGLTGTGVEVAGGVRYAAPGVQVEARGRWLAAHTEAGAHERGVSVTARMGPGAHGRGLSLALSPRWGADAGGGAQTLWRDELPGSGDSGDGDEAAIDARIGYGVSLAPRGLLTPFAEAGLAGGDDRRLRLGTRFEAARLDLGVELSGARRESADGTEHALKLDLDLRF